MISKPHAITGTPRRRQNVRECPTNRPVQVGVSHWHPELPVGGAKPRLGSVCAGLDRPTRGDLHVETDHRRLKTLHAEHHQPLGGSDRGPQVGQAWWIRGMLRAWWSPCRTTSHLDASCGQFRLRRGSPPMTCRSSLTSAFSAALRPYHPTATCANWWTWRGRVADRADQN